MPAGGGTLRVCWSPGSLNASAPHHPTPNDSNLELAQCVSSSLHRDSARAILGCHKANDWWPAWDDPDSEPWDEPLPDPEMSDTETKTTTTGLAL